MDYGLGNLRAFQHIYERMNFGVEIAKTPEAIQKAEVLILPGVGSFDWAMTRLKESGLLPVLEKKVLGEKTPILGVCVGMQMLAEQSEEGQMNGLGWIGGKVKKLGNNKGEEGVQKAVGGWPLAVGGLPAKSEKTENPASGESSSELILPHMGWNDAQPVRESPLFRGLEKPQFYFLHSYYFVPSNSNHFLGTTKYGIRFASAVGKDNVYGVQFHPEKSHGSGIRLLRNFVEMC